MLEKNPSHEVDNRWVYTNKGKEKIAPSSFSFSFLYLCLDQVTPFDIIKVNEIILSTDKLNSKVVLRESHGTLSSYLMMVQTNSRQCQEGQICRSHNITAKS